MPEFPTSKQILSDLVGMQAWKPEGQVALNQYVHDTVQRWGLGDARIYPLPSGAPGSEIKPRQTILVIDVGPGTDHADEVIIDHGHTDVVPPDDYPEDWRHPDNLIQDEVHPNIVYGLGSNDMLAWKTGVVLALRKLQRLARHRHYRVIAVPLEEQKSQGTHALFHRDLRHLVANIGPENAAAMSGEIPVGGKIDDPPTLYIGRTGRVGLELVVHGPAKHEGIIDQGDFDALALMRATQVVSQLKHLTFLEHPNDELHLMPRSRCVPSRIHSQDPTSLSTASHIHIHLNVFFSNPNLDTPTIQAHVRQFIRNALGDDGFSLHQEDRQGLPFTRPWLESPGHQYVQHGLKYLREVSGGQGRLAAGNGVADEAILVHQWGIPCITLPPNGEDEHNRNERVDIDTIDNRLVPWKIKMLEHEGSLIHPTNGQ